MIQQGDPCPRCLALAEEGSLRAEAVQPMRGGAADALSREPGVGKHCRDCAAAETVQASMPGTEFSACRVATANCRQEQMRLPGAPLGLVKAGIMAPCQPGEMQSHHEWLDERIPNWREMPEPA